MATKRQRLAQATIGGEPTLSLPAFVSTAPETSGASAAGRAASLADCYLVYVYLCRTGLWDDISLRLSRCGAFYLACTPGAVKQKAAKGWGGKAARSDGAADAAEAAHHAEAQEAQARAEAGLHGDDGGSSADEAEDAGQLACGEAAGAASDANAEAVAEAGGEEGQVFRVRTLTVPVSVSSSAPTPDRLHQLLALSDVEEGAPVSLALVDGDGTVIVSHLYRGRVPPEVLDAEGDGEEEEEAVLDMPTVMPAAAQPEDEPPLSAEATAMDE